MTERDNVQQHAGTSGKRIRKRPKISFFRFRKAQILKPFDMNALNVHIERLQSPLGFSGFFAINA